jgi:hypothetical protein
LDFIFFALSHSPGIAGPIVCTAMQLVGFPVLPVENSLQAQQVGANGAS